MSSDYDIGREHERLCDRVAELEAEQAEHKVAEALLLERIAVLESWGHHHSEEPTPMEEPEPEPEPEPEEEPEEEQEEEQEEPAPMAEVPPERKHLLHRVIWSR